MDVFPAAAQADEPIQTLQAPASLPRLSRKCILSRARLASTASFDDPTALPRLSKKSILSRASFISSASVDDITRHTSFVDVLKASLAELAQLDGDFNHVWIKEFRELYFNCRTSGTIFLQINGNHWLCHSWDYLRNIIDFAFNPLLTRIF